MFAASVFWMSFDDFTRHFTLLYVCRVFEMDTERTWFKATGTSEWYGHTAGGCPKFKDTCKNNPQFFLQVSAPTHVCLTLTQFDTARHDEHHIALFIVYNEVRVGARAQLVA